MAGMSWENARRRGRSKQGCAKWEKRGRKKGRTYEGMDMTVHEGEK